MGIPRITLFYAIHPDLVISASFPNIRILSEENPRQSSEIPRRKIS